MAGQRAARLEQLGISLAAPAVPLGSYVPARVSSGLVITSGQLPFLDGELMAIGTVGDDVPVETAAACARQCALGALAAAASAVGDLERIIGVVEVTGYVASASDFFEQPAVINGASDVLVEIFGEAGRHARSAVGVAALPAGAPVEIAVRFEITH